MARLDCTATKRGSAGRSSRVHSNDLHTRLIPTRPVLYFRGAPQPGEFTSGAFRMRDLLADLRAAELPGEGACSDELSVAEDFADRLVDLFKGDPQLRLGAAAAL